MTKTQTFQANEGKRDRLRKALPVVLEALEAAKDELEAGIVNEGLVNPNIGNSCFQQIVGARFMIKRVATIVDEAPTPKAVEGRPVYTEADRDTLRKRQQEEQ